MRIFIGPNEIAGQYRNLAIALKSIHIECDYYIFDEDSFRYGGDIGASRLPFYIRRLSLFRKTTGPIRRKLYSLAIEALAVVFFLRSLFIYDAFVFGFGRSLLRWNLDLPVLRFFGKRIVANMSHGSDMTPSYIDGAFLDLDMSMPKVDFHLERISKLRARIKRFERYASYIIGSPISSSFFSNKPFISIFHIGRVSQGFRASEFEMAANGKTDNNTGNKIKILHAPSHAPGKGTLIIRDIINRLIERGYSIEFREVSGRDNDVVLKELQWCDLVLDQVYSDLPMSGFAAEAACFGKPTVVSGYDLVALKGAVLGECFPPTIICSPDNLSEALSKLLDSPSDIAKAGREAKEFVYGQCGEINVAKRYLSLLSDQPVPPSWWYDPKSTVFLHGYGLHESSSKKMVSEMIEHYGVEGLGLSHRPDLEAAFLNYAEPFR